MVVMMWFELVDRVSNTLMIKYRYDGYSILVSYTRLTSIHIV
jgi:hypothetical protein